MILKNPQLTSKLDLVSQDPGVYLMKDATGSILYIGKAIHLRQRLRSYFADHPQVNTRIASMISKIHDFSTIICDNELEALILESTLIKKHQPPYNVLLRDDRDYP
jgi:excinuclease ABC subunit C